MKTLRFGLALLLLLVVLSAAPAQSSGAGGHQLSPGFSPFYGPGVPVTTQGVPVYWWLDPGYVWNPYNAYLYGTPWYVPPPIVAGPGVFGPPYGAPYYGSPLVGYPALPMNPNMMQNAQQQMPQQPQQPANGQAKKEDKPKPERPRDNLDQKAAMHKELQVGNQALAAGQNTVALRHYEAAGQAQPLEPLPLFHQAQAQIALGQYAKAATLVQRGLKWQPAWPQADFSARAFYGDRGTAYDQHLAALAGAIERSPNDDSLLFLMGYELWFDGKKDQAKVLFKRAASLTLDTAAIDRFLK